MTSIFIEGGIRNRIVWYVKCTLVHYLLDHAQTVNSSNCSFEDIALIFEPSTFQMPLLSIDLLSSYRELRLAHLALGFITMGYVWQEEHNPAQVKILSRTGLREQANKLASN